MSFDVFVADPTGNVGNDAWYSGFKRALEKLRATYSDGIVTTADGHVHEVFGPESDEPSPGCMVALRELNETVCALIFEIAQQTNSYIFSDDLIIKPPNAPEFDFEAPDNPFFRVKDPSGLCKALSERFGGWEQYRNRVTKS
jgi:hypothetical protein